MDTGKKNIFWCAASFQFLAQAFRFRVVGRIDDTEALVTVGLIHAAFAASPRWADIP